MNQKVFYILSSATIFFCLSADDNEFFNLLLQNNFFIQDTAHSSKHEKKTANTTPQQSIEEQKVLPKDIISKLKALDTEIKDLENSINRKDKGSPYIAPITVGVGIAILLVGNRSHKIIAGISLSLLLYAFKYKLPKEKAKLRLLMENKAELLKRLKKELTN